MRQCCLPADSPSPTGGEPGEGPGDGRGPWGGDLLGAGSAGGSLREFLAAGVRVVQRQQEGGQGGSAAAWPSALDRLAPADATLDTPGGRGKWLVFSG
jgi:hypothetical protein